jgi:NhaP-type Na+/H+ or K+/H+ antiporter
METIGIVGAVIFFVVFVGAAMLIFSMIKRTVKIAARLVIVSVLLLIAVVGAFSLWWFSGSPRPNANRPAIVRPNR